MREAVEMAAAAAKARDGPAVPPAPVVPAADAAADADPLASFYAELDAPAQPAAPAAATGDADAALDGANPFASEGGAAAHDGADSDSDDGAGKATAPTAAGASAPGPATSSDAEVVAAAAAAAAASLSARLAAQPLGSGASQLDRLLQRNAAWINLNPFEVLLLPPDASDDDVKARFRKLSALVHPDKHAGDEERANAAFQVRQRGGERGYCTPQCHLPCLLLPAGPLQEVKRAAEALHDHARRTVAAATIEAATREARRLRRRAIKSGIAEAALPPWEETLLTETRKAFAEKEHRRRNYERRMKAETVSLGGGAAAARSFPPTPPPCARPDARGRGGGRGARGHARAAQVGAGVGEGPRRPHGQLGELRRQEAPHGGRRRRGTHGPQRLHALRRPHRAGGGWRGGEGLQETLEVGSALTTAEEARNRTRNAEALGFRKRRRDCAQYVRSKSD